MKLIFKILLFAVIFPHISIAQEHNENTAVLLKSADSLLQEYNLDSAASIYGKILLKDPDNFDAMVGLGKAAFKKVEYNKCIDQINKALEIQPQGTLEASYYLGSSYGRTGDYEKALMESNKYGKLEGDEKLKKTMKVLVYTYESKLFEQMAKQAVSNEALIAEPGLNDSLLAVIYFKNTSEDEKYNALQKGLADMLITDLSQISSIRVVERTRLQKIMHEISLDMAGVTENQNRIRVAKLLKASKIIAGIF
ncbi:MAG: CsgG/HfaB family protein, partial [bacterium]